MKISNSEAKMFHVEHFAFDSPLSIYLSDSIYLRYVGNISDFDLYKVQF
jgi:hypothetical protein